MTKCATNLSGKFSLVSKDNRFSGGFCLRFNSDNKLDKLALLIVDFKRKSDRTLEQSENLLPGNGALANSFRVWRSKKISARAKNVKTSREIVAGRSGYIELSRKFPGATCERF